MIKGTGLSLLAFLSKNGSATGTIYMVPLKTFWCYFSVTSWKNSPSPPPARHSTRKLHTVCAPRPASKYSGHYQSTAPPPERDFRFIFRAKMSHFLPEKSEIKAFLAKSCASFCEKSRFCTGNEAIPASPFPCSRPPAGSVHSVASHPNLISQTASSSSGSKSRSIRFV